MREWMDRFERDRDPGQTRITHLIMLAPPNHGSALAQMGKGRLSRMKFWMQGMEPGEKILDWLEHGSRESWDLNRRSLNIDWTERGVYHFVLAGGTHDPKFYDHLNSYTGEEGSDGVVRAAAANPNYRLLSLLQDGNDPDGALTLETIETSPRYAFAILRNYSHIGDKKGILASITPRRAANHPVAKWVSRCLDVASPIAYQKLSKVMERESVGATKECAMVVVRVQDSAGNPVNDFDLLFTSGPNYSPNDLPRGFFIDRQRNQEQKNVLTYYLDYTAMAKATELGLRLFARPDTGPVRYRPASFHSRFAQVASVLEPHETVMIDLTLHRMLDGSVFSLRQIA